MGLTFLAKALREGAFLRGFVGLTGWLFEHFFALNRALRFQGFCLWAGDASRLDG